MKYLCLGYFDPQKMDALSQQQVQAIMAECRPHLHALYETNQVVADIGVALESKTLCRVNGQLVITDTPAPQSGGMIGAAFLIEADNIADATRLASLHPTTQVAAGETLGWRIEIRPVHHFYTPDAKSIPSEPVNRILEAYKQAVLAQDIDALMSLYAPNVRIFDAWGVWCYEGAEAWRKMVHTWFSTLTNERVDVTFDDVQITQGNDLSTITAIVTYASTSTVDGKKLHAMQNRISWTLKPENSIWKITHEHTSAPVGFKDQKAILQRG